MYNEIKIKIQGMNMSATMMQTAMKVSSSDILNMFCSMNQLSEDLRLMKIFSEEKEPFLNALYQSLMRVSLPKSMNDDPIVCDGIYQLLLSIGEKNEDLEIKITEYSAPKEYGVDIVSPTCQLSAQVVVSVERYVGSESKAVTVNDLYIGNSGIHDEMACCNDAHDYISKVFAELLKDYQLKPFSNKTDSKISPETLEMIMRDLSV